MNYWNSIFYGNPLKDWAIALGIIIVAFALLKIFNKIFIKRLKKWADTTSNTFDDFIVLSIQKTHCTLSLLPRYFLCHTIPAI